MTFLKENLYFQVNVTVWIYLPINGTEPFIPNLKIRNITLNARFP